MKVQITVFDPETGQTSEHAFTRSPIRIGRDPGNELRLPFSFISGRHAVVQFDDERAELVDAGSTNGVLREGRRLPSRQAVAIADSLVVTVGRLELRVRKVAAHEVAPPNALVPEVAGADATGLARVHVAIRELRPLHDQRARACAAFAAARDAALASVPADTRDLAAAMLAREFPDPK